MGTASGGAGGARGGAGGGWGGGLCCRSQSLQELKVELLLCSC